MKKILALLGIAMLLAGCQAKPEPIEVDVVPTTTESVEQEHSSYLARGRYYTSGEVITEDGNIWGYTQDIISEQPSYDNEPVYAVFDDNGTPENIYDDEIYGLVCDTETAIYDELEAKLSESFVIERDGNNLHISLP